MISGEIALIADQAEEILHAGDCAAFPKNVPDGHHLVNKSDTTAYCLEIGRERPTNMSSIPTSTW